MPPNNRYATLLILLSVLVSLVLGIKAPQLAASTGSFVDPLILALVFLLFFELRFLPVVRAARHWRFLSIAWIANFILIPTIGWGVASLFLSGQPLFFTGLLIYFMAPCTDWFLGFTRIAGGNTALGSVLVPINLISQLLLFPVYLSIFASAQANVDLSGAAGSLWQWFILPFITAIAGHQILSRILPSSAFSRLMNLSGILIPCTLSALVACIFSANVATILSHLSTFALILGAVFFFFILTYYLGEFLTRRFKLAQPERVLLTMTTAARNTPLMLALTAAALPDQPIIYAALIIGMLVEFPHLIALTWLMNRKNSFVNPTLNPPISMKDPLAGN